MNLQLWRITRTIHVSWLIAAISGAVVAGVALVPIVNQSQYGASVWLVLGLLLCGLCLWRRYLYLLPIALCGGLLIGLWRGSIDAQQLTVYEQLIGLTTDVRGMVGDDPDTGKHGEMLLRLEGLTIDTHSLAGKLWVSMPAGADVKRGDYVTIKGKLVAGFGNFSAAIYRARLVAVERPEPGDVARRARDGFADKVRLTIGEPQASLGLGYLLGQRRALPPELDQALLIAGLTHVVVASGYNLTILVRFARRLFVKVSKYLAALSASVMITAFIAVTGASPSMTRAGLVAGLSLAAWYYGRKFHPLILLPFAAAITVLINPAFAWNDLGWQLSFTAFAGVMILAPLLQRYFFGDNEPGTLRQILGETISATIVTFPILVFAFGQFSNIAIVANLLVLPLIPLAMLLTFIAGIGVMVIPPVAGIIGLPAEWLLGYMVWIAQYLADLPWALTTAEIPAWAVWAMYGAIVLACIYLTRATRYNLRDANIVE